MADRRSNRDQGGPRGGRRPSDVHTGRVVATRGRRVEVSDDKDGVVRICFLSGHRAVLGDRVDFVLARGSGGKITNVHDRRTELVRSDWGGREQLLAANLGGMLVVASASHPPYRPGLVDRYMVAAGVGGMEVALLLSKTDLGVAAEVEDDLAARAADGLTILRASATTGEGVDEVAAFFAQTEEDAPWILVGHSGVGKTSLLAALLPGEDVGPIGEISEFWDQGRHTTTSSRLFGLPGGGVLADSPGIRTFLPGRLTPQAVRDHFPGLGWLNCRYRDCLHREGEDGCVAEEEVAPDVLVRYRRLLGEVLDMEARQRPGGSSRSEDR